MSGVFYLKTPKILEKKPGAIKFSNHGLDFPKIKENVSEKIIIAREGHLILFPSSLFHETIAFQSNEDRISIAFDISRLKN